MNVVPFAKTKLGAALFAGAMLTAMSPAVHAQVITYSGPALPIPQTIDGLYVNVVTGASASAGAVPGWDFNVYDNGARISFFAQGAVQPLQGYVGSGPTVDLLAPGTVVGPASTFTGANVNGGFTNEAFQVAGTGFFGFRFINEATGSTHFGWAQISTGDDAGFPSSILSYAFELTPNTAITVVPEPGTYALMLAGLAGLGGLVARRRKAA